TAPIRRQIVLMEISEVQRAPGERGVPDLLPVLVEHELGVSWRENPVAPRELALELARRPTRIAECNQALLRTFGIADVAQYVAPRGHGDAGADGEGRRPVIVGAVNDEADLGLHRTAGEDADIAGGGAVLLAGRVEQECERPFADQPIDDDAERAVLVVPD